MSAQRIIGAALIERAAKAGACRKALKWARETPRTLDDLLARPDWADWACRYLLAAEAWRVYNAAESKALRVFYAETAEASRVYYAETAEPRRVYDAARANARRVYNAAMDKARRMALLTLWEGGAR